MLSSFSRLFRICGAVSVKDMVDAKLYRLSRRQMLQLPLVHTRSELERALSVTTNKFCVDESQMF
jgi:hypothetical protein